VNDYVPVLPYLPVFLALLVLGLDLVLLVAIMVGGRWTSVDRPIRWPYVFLVLVATLHAFAFDRLASFAEHLP
jgi:hypothetical protein